MALKKKKVDEATEVVEETVEETPVVTQEEKEAVEKQEAKQEEEGADTQRLRLATNLVSSKFNLDPTYRVCKFDDKGKVVNLTLENGDFIVNVTIKDSDRQGMYISE